MTDSDSTTPSTPPDPWPAASMRELVTMCTSPALIGLGIVPAPGQEDPDIDLFLARHFIDLLALLDEKTADQLDDIEQQAIDQALHELRMAFVEVQQAAQLVTPEHDASTPTDDASAPARDELSDNSLDEVRDGSATDVAEAEREQPDASDPVDNPTEDD